MSGLGFLGLGVSAASVAVYVYNNSKKALQTDLEKINGVISGLALSESIKNEEIIKLKQKIIYLELSLIEKESKIALLEEERETIESKCDEAFRNVLLKAPSQESFEQEIKNIEKTFADLLVQNQTKLNEIKQDSFVYIQHIEFLKNQVIDLQNSLRSIERENSLLKRNIEKAEADIKSIIEYVDGNPFEKWDQLKEEKRNLEKINELQLQKIKDLTRRLDDSDRESNAVLEDLDTQFNVLKKKFVEVSLSRDELLETNSNLNKDNLILQARLQEMESQLIQSAEYGKLLLDENNLLMSQLTKN